MDRKVVLMKARKIGVIRSTGVQLHSYRLMSPIDQKEAVYKLNPAGFLSMYSCGLNS